MKKIQKNIKIMAKNDWRLEVWCLVTRIRIEGGIMRVQVNCTEFKDIILSKTNVRKFDSII